MTPSPLVLNLLKVVRIKNIPIIGNTIILFIPIQSLIYPNRDKGK